MKNLGIFIPTLWLALFCGILPQNIEAQQFKGIEGRYHPLNQRTPPGMSGYWMGAIRPDFRGYFQQVKINLPTRGKVTAFDGPQRRELTKTGSLQAGFLVGQTYRLKLTGLPEFPGEELYPSIELIDRLHPPAGKAQQFPVPVEITADEIALARQGKLVTKVIYLEQPQLASPTGPHKKMLTETLNPDQNILAEADRRGRPMLILRLGTRAPDSSHPDAHFFGPGAPVKSNPTNRK